MTQEKSEAEKKIAELKKEVNELKVALGKAKLTKLEKDKALKKVEGAQEYLKAFTSVLSKYLKSPQLLYAKKLINNFEHAPCKEALEKIKLQVKEYLDENSVKCTNSDGAQVDHTGSPVGDMLLKRDKV